MRRWTAWRRRGALGLALVALGLGAAPAASAQGLVGIFVPYFEGPGDIGRNVSTALYFQVWRTLRRAPYPNPRHLDFGAGIAYYDTQPLRPGTPAQAFSVLSESGARLMLWGDAQLLGEGGAVVQAFLAADLRDDGKEVWSITQGGRKLRLGLPRQVFTFDAVVLDRAVVARYNSPDAMTMCVRKTTPCADMPLTYDWRALGHEGGWAQVRNSNQQVGWVNLGGLDDIPNIIADFSSALVAYYRGDFEQAARFFDRVARAEAASTALRRDAAALAAIATTRLDQPADSLFARLAQDDPYSVYVFKAGCMYRLQQALKKTPALAKHDMDDVRRQIAANRELLGEEDPWLKDAERLLGAP